MPDDFFTTMVNCTGDFELEQSGTSLISSLLLFLCGLAVVGAGLAVSLLWVYTEGRSVILGSHQPTVPIHFSQAGQQIDCNSSASAASGRGGVDGRGGRRGGQSLF